MAYLRPGDTIPDDAPLAALTGRYQDYPLGFSRTRLRNQPHDAPEFAGMEPQHTDWYIFRCDRDDDEGAEGLAIWGNPQSDAYSREQIQDIIDRDAWGDIPGYSASTPMEQRVIRGIAGLWLFQTDQAQRRAAQDPRNERPFPLPPASPAENSQ